MKTSRFAAAVCFNAFLSFIGFGLVPLLLNAHSTVVNFIGVAVILGLAVTAFHFTKKVL